MEQDTLLTGENAAFLDSLYERWQADPSSVEAQWSALFDQYERPSNGHGHAPGVVPTFEPRSIFGAGDTGVVAGDDRQAKVVQLINTYRVRGHMTADIDPLQRREKVEHPELTLQYYGLSEADLDAVFDTAPLYGMPTRAPLRAIVQHCRSTYARSIGAEFMNIYDLGEKLWVQEALETLPNRTLLTKEEELRVLRKLTDAENFERLLHTRFPGTKRFSLEGAETLVPLLDLVLEHAGTKGVLEVVLGMAHRGRLNVLANTLEKPISAIIDEFEDTQSDTWQGTGDVKYHLGYSADVTTVRGDEIHLSLAFNPSHLEAVDPVVEGRVRAKQDRAGDTQHVLCLPVLIHGDAAFSGQGLVAEVLNLSQLHGYRTGGTVHVIVNNQIGFTTHPKDGRSTPYASDVARMLGVPIFHVNGEDPRAVAAVVQIALEWRHRFHKDVIIDMYCYRKHGHNEGDEPSFTQPLLYEQIRSRPTPRAVFAQHLVDDGSISEQDVQRVLEESRADLESAAQQVDESRARAARAEVEGKPVVDDLDVFLRKDAEQGAPAGARDESSIDSPLKGLWARYLHGSARDETDTGFDLPRLRFLLEKANTVPEGFAVHSKVKRLVRERQQMARGERPINWGLAEQAAYATLLDEGYRVRLSGQDSGRGTFTHRHAALTSVETGEEHFTLRHLREGQGAFDVIDSSLSEAGVLGFEYGYSLDYPDALVMWEAQFGDFANGAQVIIDQFITAGEQKWNRLSGLTLLLPHGYEGQGPEHSSGKMERFLQMCAQDNIQVANCSTPDNFFHLLRRQTLRRTRKPLVVMTPKSLLRHPDCVCSLEDLATGRFQRVIDDAEADPAKVKRVVLCQGKVYYDLLKERADRNDDRVALVRVELLYPFPADDLRQIFERYPTAERVWCQEEPKNMGPWPTYLHWFLEHFGPEYVPRYAGRPAFASPATGSHHKHAAQQQALLNAALDLQGNPAHVH